MAMLLEPGMQSLRMGANGERCPTPSPPGSPGTPHDSCSIAPLTPSQSPRSEARSQQGPSFSVVVAIDFGTTSSGYAFSFTSDPEAIHMMRKWEGGDPGVANQKTPTSLLLTPEGTFHSFGYTARDYYHDLDPEEAREWFYFEKFKMKIHSTSDLTMKTELEAVNGKKMPALEVFAHALRFFKQHAVQELKDQCPSLPESDAIRWVLTVPAIWKQPAKQFMREAAYKAGLVSPETPEQLLIALEPEAASIYCRKLRLPQLIELSCRPPANGTETPHPIDSSFRQGEGHRERGRDSPSFLVESGVGELWSEMQAGDRYIVADCGGGTVDLTVHQIEKPQGTLKELYKASGGPYGAVGVDLAFEKLLCHIFGDDFIATFKAKRPAAWVVTIRVGGFAEPAMLQRAVQAAFGHCCRVIVPQDVGLTILKGAVLFGLDPGVVRVRRSPLTYGVGVLNKFVEGKHPREKLLVKEGKNWCTDIFEKFVTVDQSVALGEVVQRSYCPARPGQRRTIINIYCCDSDDVVYITDPGVRKCGTISLELGDAGDAGAARGRREIRTSMQFGDTEIKVTALDTRTARSVRATIDFLSN
ncbi:heat shock 70 kDa protein 12B [Geospiza fortis]|uniref:Heat shock 70 kDa protein 12B n=1 Tax=Geospiza fortis TaxID=48883 RepID=A0A8N5F4P8_GEOFO|nr:heat shock 70 kDa protein 12B [Geospiza fortis]